MEFNQGTTPYNTMYANLKKESDMTCCSHGKKCELGGGKTVKPDENQYVNLTSPKTEKAKLTSVPPLQDNSMPYRKTEPEMMSLKNFIVANNIVDGRKRKERKKKRTPPVLVDDNQSYVTLGETSDNASTMSIPPSIPPSSAPPPTEVSATESTVSSVPCSRSREALSAYIGTLSLSEAESRVTRRGELALYHLITPGGLLDTRFAALPLMLIYRTTTKKYRHYPIRPTADQCFFVDCGYPNVRKHFSLNQLVLYYKTSASFEINPDDTSADSFSWWLE